MINWFVKFEMIYWSAHLVWVDSFCGPPWAEWWWVRAEICGLRNRPSSGMRPSESSHRTCSPLFLGSGSPPGRGLKTQIIGKKIKIVQGKWLFLKDFGKILKSCFHLNLLSFLDDFILSEETFHIRVAALCIWRCAGSPWALHCSSASYSGWLNVETLTYLNNNYDRQFCAGHLSSYHFLSSLK